MTLKSIRIIFKRDSLNNFEVLHKLTTRTDWIGYNNRWFSTCSKSTSIRDVDINFQSSKNNSQKSLWPFSFELESKHSFYVVCEFFSVASAGLNVNVVSVRENILYRWTRQHESIFFPPEKLERSSLNESSRCAKCFHAEWRSRRQAKHFNQLQVQRTLTEYTNEWNCSNELIEEEQHLRYAKNSYNDQTFSSHGDFSDHSSRVHFPSSKICINNVVCKWQMSAQPFQIYAHRIQQQSRNENFAKKKLSKEIFFDDRKASGRRKFYPRKENAT